MREMKSRSLLASLALLLAGCQSVPFEQPKLVPIGDVFPREAVQAFARQLPERFETQDTLIFEFLWKEIAVLGMTSVNSPAGTFEIVSMNHVGVPLFSIGGDAGGNHLRYAFPEFRKHAEITDAVGGDVRHIYFDRVPSPSAESKVLPRQIVFRESLGQGDALEHVFGGEGVLLLEKRFLKDGKLLWQVNYYQYRRSGDYLYPSGIVYYNRANHYRLIIRVRSMSPEGADAEEPPL
jgi:hypothetical protein